MTPFRKHHEPMMTFPAASVQDNMAAAGGYRWVPAGLIPTSNVRCVALIRNHPVEIRSFDHQNFVTVGDNIWDVTLNLPSKTIRLLPFSEPFDPEKYDEIVYLDPFDPRSRIGDTLDWILGSAHYAMDKVTRHWGQPTDTKIVMDSGGAQIKLGTADYVNPHEVIDIMNKSANAGFALDVPPRINVDLRDSATLKALAYLQVRNNNVFLGERRDDLALLNVLHGVSLDEQQQWFDTVYSDGFQGYALGIDDATDVLSGVRGAIMLHEKLKGEDFWLHVFGVSGPKMIPALALFGKVHGRVTSDSSTWYEGSRRAKYFALDRNAYLDQFRLSTQMIQSEDPLYMIRQPLNKEDQDMRWMPGGLLPCQCQICTMIKNVDGMIGHYYDSTLITLHDLLTLKNFGHQWNTLAQTLPIDDYLRITRHIMGPRSADMAEYIHVGLEHGLEAAERLFRGGPSRSYSTKTNSIVANATEGRKGTLFGNRQPSAVEELIKKDQPAEVDADEETLAMQQEAKDELAMELELAKRDGALEAEPEEEQESGFGNYSINVNDIELFNEDNDRYGICHSLDFFESDSDIPGPDVKMPRYGWPLTNHVAKFSTAWSPTETHLYQTNWRNDKPEKVIWPPEVPSDLKQRVPDNISITFPDGSTMECMLNYVDVNNPAHIQELEELDPRIVDWMLYKLEYYPETFRMMELSDSQPKKQRKKADKETIVTEFYLDIRDKMDSGRYTEIPYTMDNPALKKREAKTQRRPNE